MCSILNRDPMLSFVVPMEPQILSKAQWRRHRLTLMLSMIADMLHFV